MKKLFKVFAMCLVVGGLLAACSGGGQPADDKKADEPQKQEQQAESKVQAIKSKGELVIGMSADFPPFEFHKIKGGDDEIIGFDIEMAKKIAEKLGVELKISDMDFNLIVGALKDGKVDLGISGISKTPEREKEIDFSEPYYMADTMAVVKKDADSGITDVKSLEGKKIGAQMGSVQEEIAKSVADADVIALESNLALIAQLKTGALDTVFLEKPIAEQFVKQNDDLELATDVAYKDEAGFSIGVQKGCEDLLEVVDSVVKEGMQDGSFDEYMQDAIEQSGSMAE